MIRSARVRALFACFGLAACFTTFSARVVYVQVCKHEFYKALAAGIRVNKQTICAQRGTIEDINHEPLAVNVPVRTIVADGKLITDGLAVAKILAEPLGMNEKELAEKLATDRRYVIIKKQVPEALATTIEEHLRARSLRGIYLEGDYSRFYPNKSMLCHVLGFMNGEHEGVQGIEKVMDGSLIGHDGFRYTERDRTGKEIVPYRGIERAAHEGGSVRLTIDMHLQNIAETELDTAVKQFKPNKAIVIIMRPKTGEILALANRPNFDPNALGESESEGMKNAAIICEMEPGSTFKIVTTAAALNEKLVHPDSVIFCENGIFNFGGRPLHDHKHYGDLTIDDILMKSSNIGAAKLAIMLGDQRFYEYIRRFGFGERTGIRLPGEIGGVVHPPHSWSKISITRIPMGQEVAVTPIQMITAMSAIANGGHLMMPQIVHEIFDAQSGATLEAFPPQEIRQAVSSEAAKQVRDALKTVVSDKGTAALAKVAGYEVFGKTGTASKIDGHGGYLPGKYIVSFIGGLPADNPEFVCLVMLDDAKTTSEQNYGGLVAAPIFSRIAEKAARYLNLQPQMEKTPDIILTQTQPRPERD